jgi:adenine-specific DNA-methyltransferase
LIPARKESVDFDKTQNIFIEGDNLEVLKLLYKYLSKNKLVNSDLVEWCSSIQGTICADVN